MWGDKNTVLPSAGRVRRPKVNFIYIDPPFNVGADFSFTATIADYSETTEETKAAEIVRQQVLLKESLS